MSVPPVPNGPFHYPVYLVGGYGGSPFLSCGWVANEQAKVATALDVWYSTVNLIGVQLTFADQTKGPAFGSTDDMHATFNFAPDEVMTSMTLWGNSDGTRAGHVRFTTSKNQTFDVGGNTLGKAYPVDVGSGMMVGILGRSGAEIDMFGAIFLQSPIVGVSVSNVVYTPSLAASTAGITPFLIDQESYSNPANATVPMAWSSGHGVLLQASTTFTQAAANMFGQSISVKVSAARFGLAPSGWEWVTTDTTTTSTTFTSVNTVSWGLNGQLNPGDSIEIEVFVYYGNASTNYTSTVTVSLADGTTNSYPERGTIGDIAFSQAIPSVIEDDVVKYFSPDGVEIDKDSESLRGFNLPSHLA